MLPMSTFVIFSILLRRTEDQPMIALMIFERDVFVLFNLLRNIILEYLLIHCSHSMRLVYLYGYSEPAGPKQDYFYTI